MSTTFTWYSFDELKPRDKSWLLVADDRYETPKKALFKEDCGCDTLFYDDGRTFDESYRMYGGFEHAYAWMPVPPMPTREMMRSLS